MTSPQGPPPLPAGHALIEVVPSYSAWSFILGLCKPRVSVDGTTAITKWAPTPVPVAPGPHQVEVWTRYLFYGNFGRNGVVVDARPGTITRVTWKAPGWAFSKGKVAVDGVAAIPTGGVLAAPGIVPPAPPQPVAGWYPDPAGRHEQRYFDGSNWTEHITNAGQAGTDPTEP